MKQLPESFTCGRLKARYGHGMRVLNFALGSVFSTYLLICGAGAAHGSVVGQAPVQERIERVVLIGLDGLSSEGLRKAPTPFLDALRVSGAFIPSSRGVMPSKSAPNWATILTGVPPTEHGIHSNQWWWFRWRRSLQHPTLFTALKRSGHSNRRTGAIFEWKHFGKLWDKKDVDVMKWSQSPHETLEQVDAVLSKPPRLLVLHLLGIDDVGHAQGWQSTAYLKAVSSVDQQVGALIALLDAKKLRETTLIMIASDHGGLGTKHGGDSKAERLTPVIFNGPTIKRGFELSRTINNVDLTATLVHALSLPTLGPRPGLTITEIFKDGL